MPTTERVARSDWSQDRYVAPYDHGQDDVLADLAQPERHTYRDGYGRRHLDVPFWIVVCRTCMVACNSAHHYTDRDLAVACAARHNAEHHSGD